MIETSPPKVRGVARILPENREIELTPATFPPDPSAADAEFGGDE